jgi:hypothetical protein
VESPEGPLTIYNSSFTITTLYSLISTLNNKHPRFTLVCRLLITDYCPLTTDYWILTTNCLILKIFLPTPLFVLFFFLPLHSRSTNAVFYSERGWQNFPNLFKTHKMHVKQVLNRGKLDFCVRTGID